MTRVTRDPILSSKGQVLAGRGRKFCTAQLVFHRDVTVPLTITVLGPASWKLWVAVLSNHLQGAGAYCGPPTTGRTACLLVLYCSVPCFVFVLHINNSIIILLLVQDSFTVTVNVTFLCSHCVWSYNRTAIWKFDYYYLLTPFTTNRIHTELGRNEGLSRTKDIRDQNLYSTYNGNSVF